MGRSRKKKGSNQAPGKSRENAKEPYDILLQRLTELWDPAEQAKLEASIEEQRQLAKEQMRREMGLA